MSSLGDRDGNGRVHNLFNIYIETVKKKNGCDIPTDGQRDRLDESKGSVFCHFCYGTLKSKLYKVLPTKFTM